jgi:probable rRNA maturation factor
MNIIINKGENEANFPSKLTTIIENSVKKTLNFVGFDKNVEVGITFVDNVKIKVLNFRYRNVDKETDVLSFPMLEFDSNREVLKDSIDKSDADDIILGDIVISLEKAKQQADEYGHSLEREIAFLVVHSMLHLLGFDHETSKEDEEEMFGIQKKIVESMRELFDD